MYSDKVMDHFTNPRNVGEIPDADGVGEVGNAKCGDIMRIYLKIDNNIISDVKFKTYGCGAAVATSSMATELIKGKPLEEALKLTNKAVVEALDGLPPVKIHCSVLAEEAIKLLSNNYKKPEDYVNDSEFLNNYIFSNKDIKDKIVKDYLSNITQNSPIKIDKSGSSISLTPPKQPTTIQEAGRLAKSIIKQK